MSKVTYWELFHIVNKVTKNGDQYTTLVEIFYGQHFVLVL